MIPVWNPGPLSGYGERCLKRVRFATSGRRISQSVTTPRPVGDGCSTPFLSVPRQGDRTVGSGTMSGPDRGRQGRGGGGREPKGRGQGLVCSQLPSARVWGSQSKGSAGVASGTTRIWSVFWALFGSVELVEVL